MVKSRFTDDDDALLEELGVGVEAKKAVIRTPREERIIAGPFPREMVERC